jgi:hypothetical protein
MPAGPLCTVRERVLKQLAMMRCLRCLAESLSHSISWPKCWECWLINVVPDAVKMTDLLVSLKQIAKYVSNHPYT